MGLFGGSASRTCPICHKDFDRKENVGLHNLKHVIPAIDGGPGFMWRCGCGETDGVWEQPPGAAAGLTIHMQHRHQIAPF